MSPLQREVVQLILTWSTPDERGRGLLELIFVNARSTADAAVLFVCLDPVWAAPCLLRVRYGKD